MNPTLAEFRALLDEFGFACAWSPMTQERSALLHAKLFPVALMPHIELRPFHEAAHALVERSACTREPSLAQMDTFDRFGHARIPEPCDCRGGVCCQGVLADGLTENHRRCKALSTGD